jgi:cytochrome c
MTRHNLTPTLFGIFVAISLAFSGYAFADIDADAAKTLARKNSCFKCHAPDKEKDGPSYKKVAEKYRGKPDGEEKLIAQITTGKMAKFPDGHEDEHKIINTQDMGEIKNLVNWILSL